MGAMMSFSEARMSRDQGIDYGGYDNDGSSGLSQEAFLEDRLDEARFGSTVPGSSSEPWWARIATNGIPAIADAAARWTESQARADAIRGGQINGTFSGPNGQTRVVPQGTGGIFGGGSDGGLLMLMAVGALLFVALKD